MISLEEVNKLMQAQKERELQDLRVFIIGGGFQYAKMFFDMGLKGARSVGDADIVCFTGGEDVDPAMYNEKPHPRTGFNPARDALEAGYYGECVGLKKPMIGICRGAQFLNVMNGGKLWQDVNNHAIGGTHAVIDMKTGLTRDGMTSTHHQQMRSAMDGEILAVAGLSTKKECENEKIERLRPELDDQEVVWYPSSLSLCFQPHPEHREGGCRNYFTELVDEYIVPAT